MLKLIHKDYADTSHLAKQLLSHPELWDEITLRREHPASPHREISDIWVRYNAIENYDGDMHRFNSEHISTWYPVAEHLSEARLLSEMIAEEFKADRLGAVLITKIPAGKQCYPHIDQGWHAGFYEKFALQIRGNEQQSFHVEDEILRTHDGDLFAFDNSKPHWVLNPSGEDRITMIVCIRRH
jgi:hypothetical protein